MRRQNIPTYLFRVAIRCTAYVGFWQIVLQKSFCTGDQKFSEL
jgi:hypothetical protein